MPVPLERSRICLGEGEFLSAEIDVVHEIDVRAAVNKEVLSFLHNAPYALERVCPQIAGRILLRKTARRIGEGDRVRLARSILRTQIEGIVEHRLPRNGDALHRLNFARCRLRDGNNVRRSVIFTVVYVDGVVAQPDHVERNIARHAVLHEVPLFAVSNGFVWILSAETIPSERISRARRNFARKRARAGFDNQRVVLHILHKLRALARLAAHQIKRDFVDISHLNEIVRRQSVLSAAGKSKSECSSHKGADEKQSFAFHAMPPSDPIARICSFTRAQPFAA